HGEGAHDLFDPGTFTTGCCRCQCGLEVMDRRECAVLVDLAGVDGAALRGIQLARRISVGNRFSVHVVSRSDPRRPPTRWWVSMALPTSRCTLTWLVMPASLNNAMVACSDATTRIRSR